MKYSRLLMPVDFPAASFAKVFLTPRPIKTFSVILSTLLRCLYILLLGVFFFALFKIVQGQAGSSSAIALEGKSNSRHSEYGFQLIDYTTSSSIEMIGSGYLGKDINVSFLGNHVGVYAILCSICFLLVYVGLPIYNFFSITRPLRQISLLHTTGHDTPLQGFLVNESVKILQERTTSSLKYRESTVQMLNGIGKGNFQEITFLEGDDSLSALQRRLIEISEGEKVSSQINLNVQKLEHILKAESDWKSLVSKLISLLVKSTNGGIGAIYEWESTAEESFFNLAGSYGFYDDRNRDKKISSDTGQLGELARHHKMILLENIPAGYLVIHSGMGSAPATHVILAPLLFKDELYGAIELGFFKKPEAFEIKWLERACESIAAHFFNHKINREAKHQLEVLAQRQAAELVEIHSLQKQTFGKLELKLQEMEEEKRKNEMILEGCVDGVVVFDTAGKVSFCNEAATEILGTKRENMLGETVLSLFSVTILQKAGKFKVICYASGEDKEISVRTEIALTLPDQSNIDVLITCTQARLQSEVVFTFFIQKISADLF